MIATKQIHKVQLPFERTIEAQLNMVEGCFSKIKNFRNVVTGNGKTIDNDFSFIQLF